MDTNITTVITALPGGIAAIIIAIAALKRSTIPTSTARAALRELWSWVENNNLEKQIPKRLRREIRELLEYSETDDELIMPGERIEP